MQEAIAQFLTVPGMQAFVNAHSWVWPVCEMIHYVGMSLIIGVIGILDLRILGLFKSIPLAGLRPFVPWAVVGFIGNMLTGIVFVTGTNTGAAFYIDNLSFHLKMLFLVLAILNLAIFRLGGLEKKVYETPAGADAPAAAKIVSLFSLVAWVLVIAGGRLLMYNDTLLLFLGL
jgi:uncharacterized membrane protein